MSAKCRSCGAPIEWAITEADKRMPLNIGMDENGPVVEKAAQSEIQDGHETRVLRVRAFMPLLDGGQALRRMPHHATCPQGKEWKR